LLDENDILSNRMIFMFHIDNDTVFLRRYTMECRR